MDKLKHHRSIFWYSCYRANDSGLCCDDKIDVNGYFLQTVKNKSVPGKILLEFKQMPLKVLYKFMWGTARDSFAFGLFVMKFQPMS